MAAPLLKISEGREAEIFAYGDNTVLRLLRNPDAHQQIEWEAAAMRAASAAGVRVPEVIEAITVQGRPGLVMERIDGLDMLALVGKQPWQVFNIGATSGRIQAELNSVVAPTELPPMHTTMRSRIDRQGALSAELKSFALSALDGLPQGDKVCHGDLHPGNIMRTEGEPVIIDWTNVTRGDPTADYVRTQLMLRMGDVPPGQPWVIRYGSKVARGLLLFAHDRAYQKVRPVDSALAKRWEVAVAAARIGDGIESETPKLVALLEKARART